jgi:hypothetical protein
MKLIVIIFIISFAIESCVFKPSNVIPISIKLRNLFHKTNDEGKLLKFKSKMQY